MWISAKRLAGQHCLSLDAIHTWNGCKTLHFPLALTHLRGYVLPNLELRAMLKGGKLLEMHRAQDMGLVVLNTEPSVWQLQLGEEEDCCFC